MQLTVTKVRVAALILHYVFRGAAAFRALSLSPSRTHEPPASTEADALLF